jgi:hypothetical protein
MVVNITVEVDIPISTRGVTAMATSFDELYPNLAYWVESFGWIEIGRDDYSSWLIRILDIGGMIWESEEDYGSVDATLQAAENQVVSAAFQILSRKKQNGRDISPPPFWAMFR